MKKNEWIVACVVGLVGALSAGCSGEDGSGEDQTLTGDAVRGGQIYDKYWAVDGVLSAVEPTTNHPLWASRPDQTSNTRTGADTWRCKECHGWDYKGKNGKYATGGHATGFGGVLQTSLTSEQIQAALADPAGHNYGAVLSATDLADVAAFITTRLIDTDQYIDAGGAFLGDAPAGKADFDNICVVCHGADGLSQQPTGSAGGFEDFPGYIAVDNPWEFLHKIRFGQPGTLMVPSDNNLDATAFRNLGAYSQTLPQSL